MTHLLSNRISVALAAALFMAATWLNISIENRTAPTTLVLSNPGQALEQIATIEKAPSL
jgi:hypothetical protein